MGKEENGAMGDLVRFRGMRFYTGFRAGTDCAIRARAHRALDQPGEVRSFQPCGAFAQVLNNPTLGFSSGEGKLF